MKGKSHIVATPIVLCATKIDETQHRVVSHDEIESFAEKRNLLWFETSAKSNFNVEEMFKNTVEDHLQNELIQSLIPFHFPAREDILRIQDITKKKSSPRSGSILGLVTSVTGWVFSN